MVNLRPTENFSIDHFRYNKCKHINLHIFAKIDYEIFRKIRLVVRELQSFCPRILVSDISFGH
jgi:hypothetical protein